MATLDDFKPNLSGNPIIDSLLSLEWYRPTPWPANRPLKFAYLEPQTPPAQPGGLHITASSVTAMNGIQKAATSEIMSYVSDLLHLPVIKVSPDEQADIFFASTDLAGQTVGMTYTAYLFDGAEGVVTDFQATALVYLDISDVGDTATDAPVRGNLGYEILLHEIGHALGLGHPFSGPHAMPDGSDHTGLSVMSYTDGPLSPYDSFQEWDLAALSYLYPSMERTPVVAGTPGFDIHEIAAAWVPGGADGQAVVADDDTITITLEETVTVYEDIERLAFTNGTLAFDTHGVAGQAYRIYHAAFDRQPDPDGLGYWIGEMDHGFSLPDVANGFLASAEYAARYGDTLQDDAFLVALYRNILDRDPDSSGLDYWRSEIASGMSRAGAMASFSESVENQANVEAQISDGIWFV